MNRPQVEVLPDAGAVAEWAAKHAVTVLHQAIRQNGQATWVLAGGSSPLRAYAELARETFATSMDWTRVTALIGDERMVPPSHPDSNLGQARAILDRALPQITYLTPDTGLPTADAAERYEAALRTHLPVVAHRPRLDLVWLGIGEDGHTLSLFPGHQRRHETSGRMVLPVHDSPKPPQERITLTLSALAGAQDVVVFAVGSSKREAVAQARRSTNLPAGAAARHAERHGARVTWLLDRDAANM